jgi:SAM-dependent methyltransferase
VQQAFPAPQALRVLHIAAEPPLRKKLGSFGFASYKTCSFSGNDADFQVDIQRIPFSDESFDLILCSHVLEHVPDHLAAIRELHRICSARGHVLIQVPIDRAMRTREDLSELPPAERKRLFGEVNHLRYFGTDFESMLVNTGFAVTTYEPAREIMIVDRIEQGFHPEEVLFICTRATTS